MRRLAKLSEQEPHDVGRKAPAGQESRLGSTFGGARRRLGEAPSTHSARTFDFRLGQRALHFGAESDGVSGQLGPDAQIAEPRLAGMHARLDEALVAQETARYQPVEQSLDFSDRSAVAVLAARLGTARMSQQLSPQLLPALVALSEELQRPRLQRAAVHARERSDFTLP